MIVFIQEYPHQRQHTYTEVKVVTEWTALVDLEPVWSVWSKGVAVTIPILVCQCEI